MNFLKWKKELRMKRKQLNFKLLFVCLLTCLFNASCFNNNLSNDFLIDLSEKDLYNEILISVPVVNQSEKYHLIITNTSLYQNIYLSDSINRAKSFKIYLKDLVLNRTNLTKDQVIFFSKHYLIESDELADLNNLKSNDILDKYFLENSKDYVLKQDLNKIELLSIIHKLFHSGYKIIFDDYEGYYYVLK